MEIRLKNVKVYEVPDGGVAFDASLYIDGARVGDTRNRGDGGASVVYVRDGEGRYNARLVADMETEAATHTWSYAGETYKHNLDSYIGDLLDEVLQERAIKRKRKSSGRKG